MTPLLHTAVHSLLVAKASSKSSKGGSSWFPYVILLAIVLGAYFLFIRPRNKARREQVAKTQTLEIGSEVMSVGGIMGTIVGMTDTTFDVAVADGVTMTFIRRAINPRPSTGGGTDTGDMPADPWDEPPDDLDGEGSDDDGVDLRKHEDDEDDKGDGGDRPGRT